MKLYDWLCEPARYRGVPTSYPRWAEVYFWVVMGTLFGILVFLIGKLFGWWG